MIDALGAILKRGHLTSEFWVAILALLLPVIDRLADLGIAAAGGPEAYLGGVVAAIYVASRSWVKAHAAGHAIQAANTPRSDEDRS